MTDTQAQLSERLYANYDDWKGWSAPFMCSEDQSRYFTAELKGRPLADLDVLEIGFGNGEFLGWARGQGARICGSEITPGAIEAAQKVGIALIPGDFETDPALAANSLDLIAAFDVFEHLDVPQIIAKLTACDKLLRPGGWLVLRYPNGQSPFGLAAQHGDATHVTALSRVKIEQYMRGTGFETLAYGGVARPRALTLSKRVVRGIRHALRDMHMKAIRFLYASDAELEPVVTHILAKRGQTD
jgi:2-polyprenyl-3-methyl-5-hydroxy-6-metoxy-1,4-benzoquinol methylase